MFKTVDLRPVYVESFINFMEREKERKKEKMKESRETQQKRKDTNFLLYEKTEKPAGLSAWAAQLMRNIALI